MHIYLARLLDVFLEAGCPQAQMIQLFMPFIIVIGVFYFMVIRPQQKQQKQRREMLMR